VLAWLLGEPRGTEIRTILGGAERVVASDLTLVECDRAVLRARQLGRLSERRAEAIRRALREAEAHWSVLRLGRRVVARARDTFPGEPLRTLDALHLASMLVLRDAIPELTVVSLDGRLRSSANALGFRLAPSA
jgi:predicted nucleic acid-binding protein